MLQSKAYLRAVCLVRAMLLVDGEVDVVVVGDGDGCCDDEWS